MLSKSTSMSLNVGSVAHTKPQVGSDLNNSGSSLMSQCRGRCPGLSHPGTHAHCSALPRICHCLHCLRCPPPWPCSGQQGNVLYLFDLFYLINLFYFILLLFHGFKQLFCQSHGFSGSGIWTGHSRDGFALLYDVQDFSWGDLKAGGEIIAGGWNHLTVHSPACLAPGWRRLKDQDS